MIQVPFNELVSLNKSCPSKPRAIALRSEVLSTYRGFYHYTRLQSPPRNEYLVMALGLHKYAIVQSALAESNPA